ncbi:MFS transporter [Amylibacter marinus]|uniref:MFS transporter n=2 Tax=Amylibacter marinus TaxID=1475483 RepID=A0ABQ5VVA4_9RHOB|nr:MFS transporter [Amylibacter marinus]
MMYDWAAQPYNTLLITFIFAPYFSSVVVGDGVQGQALWGGMLTIVGICLAFAGPIFGAISDSLGPKKPWLLLFSLLYVVGSFGLWWAVPNMNGVMGILVIFAIGMFGMEMSQIFVNAMLPDMGTEDEISRISGNGWALGYVGGLIALFIMLLLFAENEEGKTLLGNAPALGLDAETRQGTRSVGPITSLWYAVFMIPFFAWVPDTKRMAEKANSSGKALKELWGTIKSLPQNISLASYLVSSMFYRDALMALYGFGGIYASGVLGWSVPQIGIFGIIGGIAAALFSYFGGHADRRFGSKAVITASILILIVVTVLIIGTSRSQFFGVPLAADSNFPDMLLYVCGAFLGGAGGSLQASSRTLMVRLANQERMTEAFGLYGLAGRATAWLAPGLVGIFTYLTGSQRIGYAPLIVLFCIGLCLLYWVQEDGE